MLPVSECLPLVRKSNEVLTLMPDEYGHEGI